MQTREVASNQVKIFKVIMILFRSTRSSARETSRVYREILTEKSGSFGNKS